MFNVLNFFKRKEKAPETVFEPTTQGDSDTDITNLTHKIDRLLTNKLFEISSQTRRSATREDAQKILVEVYASLSASLAASVGNNELAKQILESFRLASIGELKNCWDEK